MCGVTNGEIEHRPDELTLQVRARAVVAQLTRLNVVRHPADRLGRESHVRGIKEVGPDQALEVRGARRVAQRNPGPPQQQIGVEHRQAFAEPEARHGRLRPVIDVVILERADRHQVPRVEEFVRCFLDTRVGVARQLHALRAEGDGIAVLEPAAVCAILEHERVLAIRRPAEQHE